MSSENDYYIYAMTQFCAGGCQRKVLGPCRRGSEEFTPEQHEEFKEILEEFGWVRLDENMWVCSESCGGKKPWEIDFSEFELPLGKLHHLGEINPDYYETVTIENLDDLH